MNKGFVHILCHFLLECSFPNCMRNSGCGRVGKKCKNTGLFHVMYFVWFHAKARLWLGPTNSSTMKPCPTYFISPHKGKHQKSHLDKA